MDYKKKPTVTLIPPSVEKKYGLVERISSIDVLAMRRSGFDSFVRAKIRVNEGELTGRVFLTLQPKTDDVYSTKDFTPEEIAAMKKQDAERDSTISPLASVVACIEDGKFHKIEPLQLVAPKEHRSVAPFLKKRS